MRAVLLIVRVVPLMVRVVPLVVLFLVVTRAMMPDVTLQQRQSRPWMWMLRPRPRLLTGTE